MHGTVSFQGNCSNHVYGCCQRNVAKWIQNVRVENQMQLGVQIESEIEKKCWVIKIVLIKKWNHVFVTLWDKEK